MAASSEYWRRREEAALKNYVKDEKEYDKRLAQIYQNMLDSCQKEIDSFYGRYAAAEGITIAEAKKRISKADIAAYERKAARYVKEKNFSKKANEEMRLYNATMRINRLEMLKANIGLELIAGHEEIDKFMAGILKGRTEDELKRQAGILGKTIRGNAAKANAIVNASFHNATFSDRIWQYQDLLRADVGKLLQSGLIQGKNPRVLARELRKTFDTSTYNSERLMRTELARVQTEAQKQSFINNGFDMYEFIVNSGCCDVCKAMDGKHFKVAKMMPGENAPPVHPHCRCSVAAWEDSEEYNNWLDYLEAGGTTAEWNAIKNSGKALENSKNGGTMNTTEMYRKAAEIRNTFKPISDKQFDDLTIEARKHGAVIERGTERVENHLRKNGASASAIGGLLMFMKDVCMSEVLEETRHFMQNLERLNDDKIEPLRTLLNEIDARRYILNYSGKYTVPREELEYAQEELERFERQLAEEWGDDYNA